MKSAGKARSNGLYRHIRTSKEIIRNLLNDYSKNKKPLPVVTHGQRLLFVRRGGFHIRPQACAAAEGLRIAAVGGGVPDAPRSGQDRSLQCKR